MKFKNKYILLAVVLVLCGVANADATRPAFFRNDVDSFMYSDAVVEAVVKQSGRWSDGTSIHLVARYVIRELFKGNVLKDEVLIVKESCIDRPIPMEIVGFPMVEGSCRDGLNLSLTGVHSEDETPAMKDAKKPKVYLFLKKNIQQGAPQLTWLEASRTPFYGPNTQTREDIPADQRKQFDRLLEKHDIIMMVEQQTGKFKPDIQHPKLWNDSRCPPGSVNLDIAGRQICARCDSDYIAIEKDGRKICQRLQVQALMRVPDGYQPDFHDLDSNGKCLAPLSLITLHGRDYCIQCKPGYQYHAYYGQGRCLICEDDEILVDEIGGKIMCLKCPGNSMMIGANQLHGLVYCRCMAPMIFGWGDEGHGCYVP